MRLPRRYIIKRVLCTLYQPREDIRVAISVCHPALEGTYEVLVHLYTTVGNEGLSNRRISLRDPGQAVYIKG